jgi:Transposase DDE domain
MSTRKSHRKSKPKRPSQASQSAPKPAPAFGTLSTGFSSAQLLAQFAKLLPADLLMGWLASSPKTFYRRAFTPLITLWYFIFQRLQARHTLSKILSDARNGGADCLSPPGKRLSQQIKSKATTAASKARTRLPVELLRKTLCRSAQEIRSWTRGLTWEGWNVGLLDGSTFRLRPHGDIAKAFPPHRPGNTKKEPYWCLVRVVAAFCLHSGVALDCAMGDLKQSEQALCAQLLAAGSWLKWIFVGDRNFGVYSVVRSATAASAHALLRMTGARARKLARQAGYQLRLGLDVPILWTPSSHDQCPQGLEALPVAGRLVVVGVQIPGFRAQQLYLFTTLTDPSLYSAAKLAQLYGQRWHIELFLRYVKTQMDLEFIECQSADMARKEWLAGLVAYNLIRSIMVAAAAQAQIPVKLLSFSRTADFFQDWLIRWLMDPSKTAGWEQLLDDVASVRQPHRRKPRPSEPRAVRRFHRDFPELIGDRAAARETLKNANEKS